MNGENASFNNNDGWRDVCYYEKYLVIMKVYRIKCKVCKRDVLSFINDKNYFCLNCIISYDFGLKKKGVKK